MKYGIIGLEVDATAVQGAQGYSIQAVQLDHVDSDNNNVYNVVRNDGNVIGQITANRGANITQFVRNGTDADGGYVYDVYFDNGNVISGGITAPRGRGISYMTTSGTSTSDVNVTFNFSDGTIYSFVVPSGQNAFHLWLADQPLNADGTSKKIEDFFEAYRGYSIGAITYNSTDANDNNVYDVTLDNANNTNIGQITANRGPRGHYINSVTLQGQDANGGNIYDFHIDDTSGTIVGSFTAPKGDKGISIDSVVANGKDANGGNVYDILSDETGNPTIGSFTSPKGDKGEKGDSLKIDYTQATAPTSPSVNEVWYDTTNEELKVYDGTDWYTMTLGFSKGTVLFKSESFTPSSGNYKTTVYGDATVPTGTAIFPGTLHIFYKRYNLTSSSMNTGKIDVVFYEDGIRETFVVTDPTDDEYKMPRVLSVVVRASLSNLGDSYYLTWDIAYGCDSGDNMGTSSSIGTIEIWGSLEWFPRG